MKVEIKRMEIEALVESESTDGAFYVVKCNKDKWTCTCQDHIQREHDCKHITAVMKFIPMKDLFQ